MMHRVFWLISPEKTKGHSWGRLATIGEKEPYIYITMYIYITIQKSIYVYICIQMMLGKIEHISSMGLLEVNKNWVIFWGNLKSGDLSRRRRSLETENRWLRYILRLNIRLHC